jgi:hypothetical protein
MTKSVIYEWFIHMPWVMRREACERAIREEASAEQTSLAVTMPLSNSAPSNRQLASFGPVSVSDTTYLRHLSMLLDEYLEDISTEQIH